VTEPKAEEEELTDEDSAQTAEDDLSDEMTASTEELSSTEETGTKEASTEEKSTEETVAEENSTEETVDEVTSTEETADDNAAGKTAEQSGNRRAEKNETKHFSYQAEISKFIRKKGRNLNAIEKANLTDAFEGVIERKRGRQARQAKLVNQARKHIIGSDIPKTITNSDPALEAAKRVAEKNTFHRQEEELIRKRAKKIKI
jgi:hypothetical protein